MEKGKCKKKNSKGRIVIRSILAVAFVIAIAYLLFYFYNSYKNKKLYEDPDRDVAMEEIRKVNDRFIEKVKELQQENPDVKGWIRIEGTIINYPLLQGTDNDYYFSYNYKKEKTKYGSIMLNYKSDIKDVNSNVIIYGHDMKDAQMFGELLNYKDKAFYETHPTIYIATDEAEAEYQIMYVFLSRVFYKDETNVFRYYQYYNFDSESTYNKYLDNCRAIQLYDTRITAEYGDQLITLITCEYSQENGRLVVVAKKI